MDECLFIVYGFVGAPVILYRVNDTSAKYDRNLKRELFRQWQNFKEIIDEFTKM